MSSRGRAWRLLAIAGLVGVPVAVFACTGEDPPFFPPSSTEDADATGDGSSPQDGAADAPGDPCGDLCDLVTGQTPHELVVDGTHVYWSSDEGIARTEKRRPGAPVETLAGGLRMPRGLAVTPSYVFWLTGIPCAEIHRRSFATGTIEKAPAGIGGPLDSVFVNGVLYYSGRRAPSTCAAQDGGIGGGIHSITEDLSDPRVVTGFGADHACERMPTRALAGRMGSSNADLVWAHADIGELCWTLGGTAAIQRDVWAHVKRMVLTSGHIFWTADEGVLSQKRTSDEELDKPATTVSTVTDATGLVYDEVRKRLYFVTSSGKVYSAEGIASEVIAETSCAAGALAQDDDFLYFTCEAQGSIKRLKKP